MNAKPFISYFLLIVSLCVLTSCGSEPRRIQLTGDSVIVAYGDSLTQGVGANKQDSYPSVLHELVGLKVINKGVSGEISQRGVTRLESFLKTNEVDLVILCHGGNDMLRRLSRSQLKTNLSKMIEMSELYGAEVLLVGVPEPSILLSTAEVYQELAEEFNLVAELNALTDLLKDPSKKSDQIHLNAAGYRELATALANKIEVNIPL